MFAPEQDRDFPQINRAYNTVFRPGRLSVGLVLPIEAYPDTAIPRMDDHISRAQLAEQLGFSALWLRDVPFHVPSFGDVGQIFDPFVYLGVLAATTQTIALGTASIVLPLRHPAHVAKAAASADVLSGGRVLLGIASGDRPKEYPALNLSYADRGASFRDAYAYIRSVGGTAPGLMNPFGTLQGNIDLLPKPSAARLPLLITGSSQQTAGWIAQNGDGWMTYTRDIPEQGQVVADYRERLDAQGVPNKPVIQSLHIDLLADAQAAPGPVLSGFRAGTAHLRRHLLGLQSAGVNHVALNLRFHQGDIETALRRIADEVLPEFPVT